MKDDSIYFKIISNYKITPVSEKVHFPCLCCPCFFMDFQELNTHRTIFFCLKFVTSNSHQLNVEYSGRYEMLNAIFKIVLLRSYERVRNGGNGAKFLPGTARTLLCDYLTFPGALV